MLYRCFCSINEYVNQPSAILLPVGVMRSLFFSMSSAVNKLKWRSLKCVDIAEKL